MQDFIDWLVDNWQFVSSIGLNILCFILLLFRKKYKVVDSAIEFLMYKIPLAIRQAEVFSAKDEKLEYALDYLESLFVHEYPNSLFKDYRNICVALIENVLNTPQKKGGK